jgi:hypothetical protein
MDLRYPAALAALLLACASAPAHAETQYALTCVGTNTDYTIYYQYRWGEDGEWHDASVDPGKWKNHTWDYDYPGEDESPQFMIRYDDDLSDGENQVITRLDSYAAEYNDCEDEGKTYDFYEQDNELFVQEND